jgi:hypothetical protein
MPGKFTGMPRSQNGCHVSGIGPRASSTSFSGNCGAKFGRKLKNLSETTTDDRIMRMKKLRGARPSSGVGEGHAATGFSLQGRSALRIQLGIVSFIAADVALGGNVRVGHATVPSMTAIACPLISVPHQGSSSS